MTHTLRFLLIVGVLLGLGWTLVAATAQGAGGLGAFGLFLVLYTIYAIFFLIAAWAFWKHPGDRMLAGWVMVLPIIFFVLPNVLRSMAGGALDLSQLQSPALLTGAALFLFCWVAPQKAVAAFPGFLLQSRVFNWLILCAMVIGWLAVVAALAFLSFGGKPGSGQSGDWLVAYMIVFGTLDVVVMGVASLGTSTWAWVSLRGGSAPATRKLNIAQLVLGAPGMAFGAAIAAWLSSRGQL